MLPRYPAGVAGSPPLAPRLKGPRLTDTSKALGDIFKTFAWRGLKTASGMLPACHFMYTIMKKSLALALLAAALFSRFASAGPAPLDDSETLNFGLISTASPQAVTAQWQPLLDDLGKAIGITVIPKTYDEYAGVVWGMGAGKVQIAWLGNKSAVEAVDRAGGEVAFQMLDMDGDASYRSHLITRDGTGLTSAEEVFSRASELTYGDGDPNSTSGHVIPGYYLFTLRGLDPRAIFKRVVQNNHEGNFLGVAEGRIDVATSNSTDLQKFKIMHPEKWKAVYIIWTSPAIPSDPIVWRTDLPVETKERIQAFLLDYGHQSPGKSPATLKRERAVLSSMARSGFRRSDNRQLLSIRQIETHRLRSRIEANGAISDTDRARQLEQIDAKLRRFEIQ